MDSAAARQRSGPAPRPAPAGPGAGLSDTLSAHSSTRGCQARSEGRADIHDGLASRINGIAVAALDPPCTVIHRWSQAERSWHVANIRDFSVPNSRSEYLRSAL